MRVVDRQSSYWLISNSTIEDGIRSRAPASADFRVRAVSRSIGDLEELRRLVQADRAWLAARGRELISPGIDTVTNSLLVGIRGATESDSELLSLRYGPGVSVRDDDDAFADACTVNTCWPQKGGIKVQSAATGNICTSGFTVRIGNPIQYGLLTAGHCIKVGGKGNWKHDTNAHTIGTTTGHTYAEGSNADAAIIKMSSAAPPASTLNYFVYEDGVTHAVSRLAPLAEQIQGDPVCMSGWGTRNGPPITIGRKCGLVTVPDVERPSCLDAAKLDCVTIKHQWEMNFDTTGGDSGGPISTGISSADGILVDSVKNGLNPPRAWYSPIDWAIPTIDQLPNELRWRVCLNSPCTAYQ